MNEELLTRLVDALEGINENLSEIALSLSSVEKNLDECIYIGNNGSKFFQVCGEITTFN